MHRIFTAGAGNPKTLKGEASNVRTLILMLAPHDLSGHNVCSGSTAGCRSLCLHSSARERMFPAIREARLVRTWLLFHNRPAFIARLHREIAEERQALPAGWTLAVRPNGLSDLPRLASDVAAPFLGDNRIRFYDYSKHPAAMLRSDGVHRTFSRSEVNHYAVAATLGRGQNVAVVFGTRKGQPLPETYMGNRVIDGDVTDLRYLDPSPVIVGLRAKGMARNARNAFVVAA